MLDRLRCLLLAIAGAIVSVLGLTVGAHAAVTDATNTPSIPPTAQGSWATEPRTDVEETTPR